jgi:hypothetical protein
MVINNNETTCIHTPFGLALVALAERMQLPHGVLDTLACQATLGQAFFGVDRPGEAIDRHRRSTLRTAWEGTLARGFKRRPAGAGGVVSYRLSGD